VEFYLSKLPKTSPNFRLFFNKISNSERDFQFPSQFSRILLNFLGKSGGPLFALPSLSKDRRGRMFPENRYIRERPHLSPSPDEKQTLPPAPSLDPSSPTESPLHQVERSRDLNLIPLPGGGWRNLEYKGPLENYLERIEQNYPLYREAERRTGVNWKILAAVHYRESDLGMNKAARGNEFQFSGSYRKRATGDLLHDAVEAGNILQEKALRGGIWPLLPDQSDGEGVRIALFRYNGTGYRRLRAPGAPVYDRSPYVMNQIDDRHRDMRKYRFDHEPHPSGVDRQWGAVFFIRELAKAFVD
jgi:hypothetical protein